MALPDRRHPARKVSEGKIVHSSAFRLEMSPTHRARGCFVRLGRGPAEPRDTPSPGLASWSGACAGNGV